MDTLVKFCLAGLIIGAWFSEYRKALIKELTKVHPALLFTLLVGLCILLIQVNASKNAQFIEQNPSVVVSNWSIIP